MRLFISAILVFVLASALSAGTNDYWQISLRACDADGYQTDTRHDCVCGTRPSASDGLDAADLALQSVNQNCAWITCFDLGSGYGFGYYADWRAPVGTTPKTWNLKLRVGSTWPEPSVYLRVWNPAGTFDINGTLSIALKVLADPTGTYSPGHFLIPVWDANKNGTPTAPAYTFTFGNAAALKTGAAVELQIVAGSGSIPIPCTIGEARSSYAGQLVSLAGVTASSGAEDIAGLWVTSDGLPGLHVSPGPTVARGEVVDMEGVVNWTFGVPTLGSAVVKSRSGNGPIARRCVTGRTVANDPRETLDYTGLNLVGMLCVVCGEVTATDVGLGVFYVEDGSGLMDGLGPAADQYRGIRVSCGLGIGLPAVNSRVRVTGVRSVERHELDHVAFVNGEQRPSGQILYVPVVVVRESGDIYPLTP